MRYTLLTLGALSRLPLLTEGLSRVTECLRTTVESTEPLVTDVASHLVLAGGKRIRPALCLAASLVTLPDDEYSRPSRDAFSDRTIWAAAATELIHLGSLYHDDVLDNATVRRGVPSANAKWGNFMAIITGDYLLARASALVARVGLDATDQLANTVAELCEGQVREQRSAFDITRTQEHYELSISGKTASLLSTSMTLGALTAGLPHAQVDALKEFGHAFGMAFQIRDDILDLTGSDNQLGKPAGNDVMAGVYTLPVIFALDDEVVAKDLRHLLGQPIDEPERDRVLNLVGCTDASARARKVGQQWAERATLAIAPLPDTEVKRTLQSVVNGLFVDLSENQVVNA